MSLVIVGSLAFDTIETPHFRKEKIIGGSCSYSALAASYFSPPKIVAVIGEDFPQEIMDLFHSRGIDTRGVKTEAGKTFHWQGRYGHDPNQRTTIKTELNVFKDFKPQLIPEYRTADIVFLGNIDPDLQDDTLKQVQKPKLVAMDTIQLWIQSKLDSLLEVLAKVDIFFANDEEVKLIAQESNLIKAGKALLAKGPSLIIIKKGEHGALLMGRDYVFGVLAYPCETVVDPTGAGDSFGGGFLGYLDKVGAFSQENIRKAAVYGSVMASFTIEEFSIDRLKALTAAEIESRYQEFKNLVTF
jgi:sugar/nucleoside kinase (ribokinase family)